MSRHTKISKQGILTKKLPRPSDDYFDFELGVNPAEKNRLKPPQTRLMTKQISRETADSSDSEDEIQPFRLSKIQKAATTRIQAVYRRLKQPVQKTTSRLERTPDSESKANPLKKIQLKALISFLEKEHYFDSPITPKRKRYLPSKNKAESELFKLLESKNPDAIGIPQYLLRFFEFGNISDEVMIAAYIYLERALARASKQLGVQHLHKLLAGCLLLAHKYLIDVCYLEIEGFGCIAATSSESLREIEIFIAVQILELNFYISEKEFKEAKINLILGSSF